MKLCSKCKKEKQIIDFRNRSEAGRENELRSWCRECERVARRDYGKRNKSKLLLKKKINYRNKESVRLAYSQYRKLHLKERSEYQRIRVLRKRENGGSHTESEWNLLKKKYGFQCVCCGVKTSKLTRDHVVSISLGGRDDIENIQPLCSSCNSSKKLKIVDFRSNYEY